ncbi:hypothetical protein PV325_001625 [Microctonus aethiopoides]|nr:hypothetical protein PV325_001625 [Microctonus aethiopoides]
MDSSLRIKYEDPQLLHLLRQRENNELTGRTLSNKLYVTDTLISRLGLEKELDGHRGCVNCLEWNESGRILASASDDMHLIVWDPFRYKRKLTFHTGHSGNIFSVKFMPKSNDSTVVTGAGDSGVRTHDISVSETTLICSCHTNRVKRIATARAIPFIFWSAAEDGLILQHDTRIRHNCKSNDCKNVLVDLVNHAGRRAEAKCVAVNPTRPELVAVGANDPYVRMYDRRMIKIGQVPAGPTMYDDWPIPPPSTPGKGDPDDNIPVGCAQYFIAGSMKSEFAFNRAGHLRSPRLRDNCRCFTSTYITFSADGSELLVNMGGEQIYLFDINKNNNSRILQCNVNSDNFTESLKCSEPQDNKDDISRSAYEPTYQFINATSSDTKEIPERIEKLKHEADLKFQQQHYTQAINFYNEAINKCPHVAVLYANRAAALMKRRWDGDIYSALRDCQTTLVLNPENVKAHFRLARCLHDLNRPIEASRVIDDFRDKFSNYSSNSSYRALRKDITEAMNAGGDDTNSYQVQISAYEYQWRHNTTDYKLRFCGHCNTTTDIKEANYFGNDRYIVAGSDDGSFFIWDRFTTNIVRVLRGDERIVNCLQPHPSTCLLATSGIDPVIRLWSPLPEDGSVNEREIENFHEAASANQVRMNRDPFNMMMINMGYRLAGDSIIEDEDDPSDPSIIHPGNCRTS